MADFPALYSCSSRTALPGDHLRIWRGVYWHHAIFVGNGRLIEFGGGLFGGPVAYVTWCDFAKSRTPELMVHADALSSSQIVSRAKSILGRTGFHLLTANCEHFANWCATGRWESHQAQLAGVVVSCVSLCILATNRGRVLRSA